MKVQIENPLMKKENLDELNIIIRLSLNANSLTTLKQVLVDMRKFDGFKIGFGGSHCWVKELFSNGEVDTKNTLVITER